MVRGGAGARWTAVAEGLWCPVVVARPDHQLLLLGRGAGGELISRRHDGEGWSAAESSPCTARGTESPTPVAVAWPVTACADADVVHLVATSPDGALLHGRGDGTSWEPFDTLGHPASSSPDGTDPVPMGLMSAPAACLSPAGLEVFATGLEGDVLHTRCQAEHWVPFVSLGMPVVTRGDVRVDVPVRGRVAACALAERLVVLLRGPDGDLVGKLHDGVSWGDFTSLGNPRVSYRYPPVEVPVALAGEPSAVARHAECVDVVVRGPKGDLLYRRWDAQGWSDFHSLGAPRSPDGAVPFIGDASVCATAPDRLDVVARALDGRVYHAVLNADDLP